MPRDFLSDDNAPSSESQMGNVSPRDFLAEPEKEGLGYSAIASPFRIGTDIITGAYHALQKIPGMYEAAKTEIPGLMKLPYTHPLHSLGQGVAGINEAINSLAQAPLGLAQYGANRLHLLPQAVPNTIAKITPEDTTQAINQIFGQPQYPGEALQRGVMRDIPGILSGTKLLSAIKPSEFLATKNLIKNSILNTHDALENRASEGFKTVSNEVANRNLPHFEVDPYEIENLKEYFPKTRTANKLISDAQTGDYNALRKIQSDLYTRGKNNLGSSLEADRLRGSEMLEKRDNINQAISNNLEKMGQDDLNAILNNARADYRTLQQVYYNSNMNNAIVNMVNKDYRKVPKNLIDILGEESNPMQELLNFHPGLENALNKHIMKKNAFSSLRKYLVPAAAAGLGGYEAVKYGTSPK